MRYEININSAAWQRKGDELYFRGFILHPDSGEIISDVEALSLILNRILDAPLLGQFTILFRADNSVYALSDASKVYPLWYRRFADRLVITDDFYSLSEGATPDPVQRRIILQSGSTIANDTIFREVKRIPRYIHFKADNANGALSILTPVRRHAIDTSRSADTIETNYCEVIDRAFGAYISSLRPDQQIVLPLSGGYDSRLTACILRRSGRTNVLAYTMGRDTEGEQNIAREVADRLGFRFVQIDFQKVVSPSEVETVSDDFRRCIDFVAMGQNFEWASDYYAVRYLRSLGLLQPDAVFFPGFCGDVLGGSMARKTITSETTTNIGVANRILATRFERGNPFDLGVCSLLSSRIAEYHHNYTQFHLEAIQPNKIVNACRVFLYFGYDVRLPFFDSALLQWCYTMPYRFLKDRIIYNEVLEKHYFAPYGLDYKKTTTPHSAYLKNYLKSYIKAAMPHSFHVRHRNFIDIVQEDYFTTGIRRFLLDRGEIDSMDDFVSPNEVMTKYLLHRLLD